MRRSILAASLVLLSACSPAGAAPATIPVETLTVNVLYPGPDTIVEMGGPVRFIIEVTLPGGEPWREARVSVSLRDPAGSQVAVVPAQAGQGDVYRSSPWSMPHRSQAGTWSAVVQAEGDAGLGQAAISFEVRESFAETLLAKYGFWIDPPAFSGITPALWAEKGDADDGMIRWGGTLPAQHVLPEEWLEIHWRYGDFDLDSAAAVRTFLLEQVGDFGFMPIRELGAFEPFSFQERGAWKADARGAFQHVDMEWVVFFASETARTWAIGTTFVLPPAGLDPHTALRESVELQADVHPSGVAPEPLARLNTAPVLVGPPLGSRFEGEAASILLEWAYDRPLADDEYFEVEVDYNYQEANPRLRLATRESEIRLPADLYRQPNCRVFNWQVTVMLQTSATSDGRPIGVPVSYRSFYHYVLWVYPPGTGAPFPLLCPNAQD